MTIRTLFKSLLIASTLLFGAAACNSKEVLAARGKPTAEKNEVTKKAMHAKSKKARKSKGKKHKKKSKLHAKRTHKGKVNKKTARRGKQGKKKKVAA